MNETPVPRQAAAASSELPVPAKPTLIPIIVGIVGKREIDEDGPTVEREIYRVLVDLRRRYPDTPILVLTSLAEGADWWAARAVARLSSEERRKPGAEAVRLVCPLPFARALYEQDFASDHKERFARLLDKREIETDSGLVTLDPADLSVFALRPLVGADPAKMARSGDKSGPHRTLHYEQCGMFIADACHLLIAVLPEKEQIEGQTAKPERVGGTARILHYKCTDALPREPSDPSFDDLVAALEVPNTKLSRVAHDPATHRLRRLSKELPEPLPPAQWFTRSFGHVWQLVPGSNWKYLKGAETEDRHSASGGSPEKKRPKRVPAHKGEAYALMEPFDAFNRRVKRAHRKGHLDDRYVREEAFAKRIAKPRPAGPIGADEYAAVVHLSRLRGTIAELQDRAKTWADRSLRMLAALFVATVGVFTHYKIWHHEKWAMHVYFILLLLATGWYALARYRQWSAIHDDYRAVAEALRAQRGWRLAGIRERAEWHYRAGTTQQLERVRQGIETVNTLIAIENRAADTAEPKPLIDLARQEWVGEQITYFTKAHAARIRSNARHTLAIFGFFYLGVGLFLALWHHSLHAPAPDAWPILARIWSYALEAWEHAAVAKPLAIAIMAVSCVAFVLRFRHALPVFKLLQRWIDAGERWIAALARNRRAVSWLTWPYPVLWGLLPVVAGLWLGNAALGYAETHHEIERAERWLGLAVALLNAIAAAAIYMREKLAIEPEERSYEEMQHVFALADDLLEQNDDPKQQREVLVELGQEALAENAYWLRAHRERPIEQIPG